MSVLPAYHEGFFAQKKEEFHERLLFIEPIENFESVISQIFSPSFFYPLLLFFGINKEYWRNCFE